MNNIEVIKELYRAFKNKDYEAFCQITTDDLEWIQNEGFPGGATYKGALEVIEKVFKGNDHIWESFAYEIEQLLDAGDSVIVIGSYSGYHRVTGKYMQAAAAHVYDLYRGKVCRFRMFADTKTIWNAMS